MAKPLSFNPPVVEVSSFLSSGFLSAPKIPALKAEAELNNPGAAVTGVADSGFLSVNGVGVLGPVPKSEAAGCLSLSY